MTAEHPSRPSRRAGIKRTLLIVLAVLVGLLVAGVLAGPALLSGVAAATLERTLSDDIEGRVEVRDLRITWTGPQRVGALVLEDPDGAPVATLAARTDVGLLDLALGARDLGLVTLDGEVELRRGSDGRLNLARALASGPGQPVVVSPDAAPAPPQPAPAEPIRVPRDLAFRLDATGIEIRYVPDDSSLGPIGLRTVKGEGSFAAGSPVDLTIEAETLDGRPALTIEFRADPLFDDQGVLALAQTTGRIFVGGSLPPDYTDAIGRIIAPEDAGTATVGSAPDGGLSIDAQLAMRDGRLRLADPDRPATLSGRIPASILRLASAGETRVHIDTPPRAILGIYQLDLPLPASGSFLDADFRDAIVVAAARTDPITGTIAVADQAPRPVRLQPNLRLQPLDRLFNLSLTGTLDATYDGVETGEISFEARAAGLLNEEGRPRLGPHAPRGDGYALLPGPEYLRLRVRAEAVPTDLLQPAAERLELSLREVAGPTLEVDIRAGVRQGTDELPTSVTVVEGEEIALPPVGEPYLAGTVDSRLTTLWFDTFIDADSFRTRNKGIKIQSDAAGVIARALLRNVAPESELEIRGEGMGIIELTEVYVPLTGEGPNLRAAAGNYRAVFGKVDLQAREDARPLSLESFDVEVTLRPNDAPTWGLDARAMYEGQRFALRGNGEIPGAIAPRDASPDTLGLTLEDARPTGRLQILDVPSRVAAVVSDRAARIAEAAAGGRIGGTIESSRSAEGGPVRIEALIESDGAVLQGGFAIDARRIVFDDSGLLLTLLEPGRLLNTLAETGEREPPLTFQDSGRATLTVRNTEVTLDQLLGEEPRTAASARLAVDAQGLGARIATEGGRATFRLDSLDASLALTDAGDAELSLTSSGTVDGAPTSSSGTLLARAIRDDQGGLDLAGATLGGSWNAVNIPTSLIALVDPANAQIIRETVGDTVDLALTARDDADAPRGGWRLVATGRAFESVTAIALGEEAIRIGPTDINATLRPRAFDAAMAAYQPDLAPRPALRGPVGIEASAQPITLPLRDGLVPSLDGGLALDARLRTTGDLIVENLPAIEEGAPGAIGIRGLLLTATPSGAKTDLALDSTIFDPASGRTAATLAGSARVPVRPLSATLTARSSDTGALDAMLATGDLLREMVGPRVALEVRATAPEAGRTAPILAAVDSPRLKLDAALTRDEQGIALVRPATVDWDVSAATAQRLLFATPEGRAPALRVQDDVSVNLRVEELRIGPPATPFRPGVLRLAGDVRTDPVTLASPAGERVTIGASAGRIQADPSTGALVFSLDETAPDTQPAPDGAPTQGLSIDATLTNYADASGAPTPERARLTSTITGTLPSALVDELASMNGNLAALAGPTMRAEIRTQDLSRADATGTVGAVIDASNADLDARGRLESRPQGPVLAITEPAEVSISRVTNEASREIIGVLFPLLRNFEKTDEDQPAVVRATGVTLPLDGRTESLNATLSVDPGTMRFETRSFFARLLDATSNKSIGTIGRRLEPFEIVIEAGVASYDDAVIPAGEFDIETYGTVNLNEHTMNVYALVPWYAVSDDVAAALERIPGLGKATRIPIRAHGDLDSPQIGPDIEELLRRLPESLGEGLEDAGGDLGNILKGVGDLLERAGGRDKKGKDKEKDKSGGDGGKSSDGG